MAQGSLGTLSVNIDANMRGFNQSMNNVQSRLQTASQKITDIGSKMTASLTLPLVAIGGFAIKMATDFEESLNKVDVAFKNNSQSVIDWSKTTLDSFGIAQGEALDMAALFGDMATSMGINTEQAAGMSTSLVGLAGDLASFKNIRQDVAATALKSVFTGETESLKELGVVMTQANLESFAMSKGITKNIKDMTQAEKVNLRYAFVLEATKNAQGDFANTSDGAANSTRIFWQSMKELGQVFGEILLPAYTKVIRKMISLTKSFKNLSKPIKIAIVVLLSLTAIIGPLLLSVGTLIGLWATFGAAIASVAPVILGITAVIGGLVAIGHILYRDWQDLIDNFGILWLGFQKLTLWIVKQISNMFTDLARDVIYGIKNIGKVIGIVFPNIRKMTDDLATRFEKMNDDFNQSNIQQQLDLTNKINEKSIEIQKRKIKEQEAEKEKEKELTKVTEDLTNEYNINTDAILSNIKTVEDLGDTYEDAREKIVDAFDDIGEGIIDSLKNMYDEQIELEEKSVDRSISIVQRESRLKIGEYNKVFTAKLKTLDEETRASIMAIENQIKGINNLTDKEEEELEKQAFEKEKVERIKAIAEEDSLERRADLQADFNDFLAKRERKLLLEQRRDKIDSLRDEMDAIRNQAQEKKRQLEAEFEAEKTNLEEIAKRKTNHLMASLSESKFYHSERIKEENLEAEARKMIIDNNQQEIVKLIKSYNPEWLNAGKSLGESLLEGLTKSERTIKNKLSSIMRQISGVVSSSANISPARVPTTSTSAISSSVQSSTPIPSKSSGTTVNITGNTISGERDFQRFADKMVRSLRTAGVNP